MYVFLFVVSVENTINNHVFNTFIE